MKSAFVRSILVILFLVSRSLLAAETADDWRQITHGGLSFEIPADWQPLKERQDEGQWGERDQERREAVMFSIARERRPERQLTRARKEGMTVEEMTRLEFGSLGADRYRVFGTDEKLGEVEFQVVILDSMLADGDRVTYSAAAINRSGEAVGRTLERVMGSVQPTGDLIDILTGSSRQQLFDGAISVEVRNNWERRDYSDSATWEPPGFSLWGGRLIGFTKGYGLTGSKGLLGKLVEPTVERAEWQGMTGWRFRGTGVAVTYGDKMRQQPIPATTTVFVSDTCLEPGERFGYVINGSEEQLAEFREPLDKVMASVDLQLPETAGPCAELLPYEWKKELRIAAPRSWRRDMNRDYQFSFYGRDLAAGADVGLYVYHGNAEHHPVAGENSAPEAPIATLTIAGYPTTHYRQAREQKGVEHSSYDYYVLDTRMRYKQGQPAFLYFRFQSSPPASDAFRALQREMLATVVLGEAWSPETPVERVVDTESAAERPTTTDVTGASVSAPPAQSQQIPPAQTAGQESPRDAAALPLQASEPEAAVADETAPAAPDEAVARKARYEAARSLRAEGADLQQQGDLRAALEKYRQSLARFPDARLEAHVERIEALLAK